MSTLETARLASVDSLLLPLPTRAGLDDRQVHDAADGSVVASLSRVGGASWALADGLHAVAVNDDRHGPLLFRLVDRRDLGADRFEVLDADGLPLARLTAQQWLGGRGMLGDVVDGTRFEVASNVAGNRREVRAAEVLVARVESQRAGWRAELTGRTRSVLELDPAMPPVVRCAVLGAVLALDLLQARRWRRG